MNSPLPLDPRPVASSFKKASKIPAATVGATLSGTLAAGVIYLLGLKGITFPAGVEAQIAVVFAAIGAHLPKILQLRPN